MIKVIISAKNCCQKAKFLSMLSVVLLTAFVKLSAQQTVVSSLSNWQCSNAHQGFDFTGTTIANDWTALTYQVPTSWGTPVSGDVTQGGTVVQGSTAIRANNNNFSTQYFRHIFTVAGTSCADATLQIVGDNGVRVYLNGNLLTDSNLSFDAGAGSVFTNLTFRMGNNVVAPIRTITVPSRMFQNGRNVLAVEHIEVSKANSQSYFSLGLSIPQAIQQTVVSSMSNWQCSNANQGFDFTGTNIPNDWAALTYQVPTSWGSPTNGYVTQGATVAGSTAIRANNNNFSTQYFRRDFTLVGKPCTDATLQIVGDNCLRVYINGTLVPGSNLSFNAGGGSIFTNLTFQMGNEVLVPTRTLTIPSGMFQNGKNVLAVEHVEVSKINSQSYFSLALSVNN